MKNREKRKYIAPQLSEIEIDRMILIQLGSDNPPEPLDITLGENQKAGTASPKTQNPTQKSGFDENPFER